MALDVDLLHVFRRDALSLICDAGGFKDLRIGTDNFLAHFVNHLTGSLVFDETLVAYRLHGSNNFNKRPPWKTSVVIIKSTSTITGRVGSYLTT